MKAAILAALLTVSCSAQMKTAGGFKHNGGMSMSPTATTTTFVSTTFEGAANCSVGGLTFATAAGGTGTIDSTFAHGGTNSCKLAKLLAAGVNNSDVAAELDYTFAVPNATSTSVVYGDFWWAVDATYLTGMWSDPTNQDKMILARGTDGNWLELATGKNTSSTTGGGWVQDDRGGSNHSLWDGILTTSALTWNHFCFMLDGPNRQYTTSFNGTILNYAYPNVGPTGSGNTTAFRLGHVFFGTGGGFAGGTMNMWLDDIVLSTAVPSGCGFPATTNATMQTVVAQTIESGAVTNTPTATFSSFMTGMNSVAVDLGIADTSTTLTSCADSAGNTYTSRIGPISTGSRRAYVVSANGIQGGAKSVVCTLSGSATVSIIATEQQGTALTGSFDAANSATFATCVGADCAASGNINTVANNEIIHGFALSDLGGTACSAGTGFTRRAFNDGGSFSRSAEDKKVSSTGTYNAIASCGNSTGVIIVMGMK